MKIAIISGGKIRAHESEKSAQNIMNEFVGTRDTVYNIHIDKNDNWYKKGVISNPHHTLPYVDSVIDLTKNKANTTAYQALMKDLNISPILNHEVDNSVVRRLASQLKITTPDFVVIRNGEAINEKLSIAWRKLHTPIIARSAHRNAPTLISHNAIHTHDHVRDIHKRGDDAILDGFVKGRVYHVIAIRNFRGQKVYTTTIVEKLGTVYGKEYVRSHSMDEKVKEELRDMVTKIHNALGSSLSQYDFVHTGKKLVLLGATNKPAYTDNSLLKHVFESHGITFREIAISRNV
jgi:D-alanine-D-alanine ligase-like ATP-grasp enzyme